MAEPAIEIRGLEKTFRITRRKKMSTLDRSTFGAFKQVISDSFSTTATNEETTNLRVVKALSSLDLDVMPGEVLGIIGRNGAGKSTLLKILARVIEPSAGHVKIRGRVVSLLELGLGFAPDMTVRENIYLYCQLAGMRYRDIVETERRILEFAELTRHRDEPLRLCPSGSFVRLAFSAMMGIDADVILADEILAVGDAKFRARCEERILNVSASGESVLFVSHDLDAIRRCCARTVWIDAGQIRMIGPTEAVTEAYTDELLGRSGTTTGSAILDLRPASATGSPIGALQLNADAFLETICRVEGATFACVDYELFLGKILVFRATSPWTSRAIGDQTFRAALEIPAHLLNDRLYELKATLMSSPDRMMAGATKDIAKIEIDVMNTDNADSVWADWKWSRRGLISPRMAWTHRVVEEDHVAGS